MKVLVFFIFFCFDPMLQKYGFKILICFLLFSYFHQVIKAFLEVRLLTSDYRNCLVLVVIDY